MGATCTQRILGPDLLAGVQARTRNCFGPGFFYHQNERLPTLLRTTSPVDLGFVSPTFDL